MTDKQAEDAERPPEELEAEAGRLLVASARARKARMGPNDAHELRHLLACVEAGNSDPCDGGTACPLDARAYSEDALRAVFGNDPAVHGATATAGRPSRHPRAGGGAVSELRTEAGRALVDEPEWSDKAHRRQQALAIEAEAREQYRQELVAAVFALRGWDQNPLYGNVPQKWVKRSAVLALLSPDTGGS